MRIDATSGLVVGLCVGLGLWAAAIAGMKQRNMLLFGTLATLFPVIGVVAAILARDASVPKRRSNVRTADTRALV